MPPRKRAESKPAAPAEHLVEAEPDETSVDEPDTTPPADDAPNKESALKRSGEPCTICFPDGWGEGIFSRGCEHGTWIKN